MLALAGLELLLKRDRRVLPDRRREGANAPLDLCQEPLLLRAQCLQALTELPAGRGVTALGIRPLSVRELAIDAVELIEVSLQGCRGMSGGRLGPERPGVPAHGEDHKDGTAHVHG